VRFSHPRVDCLPGLSATGFPRRARELALVLVCVARPILQLAPGFGFRS
jgi:hypothetical protein